MRAAFINSLMDLARTNEQICLLVGDVGYSLVEPFRDSFPTRFINIGIAEQNMIGIATGLALSNKVVFVYSLANFPILRCIEQIRNDVCYHNANVKIVTSGGGLAYGALGVTHAVTEDLAVMRALPNMTILAPGDPVESGLATKAIAEFNGPCYLRLARTGDPVVHGTIPDFQIGKAIVLRQGRDVCMISCGGMLPNTVKAAERLSMKGIDVRILSMHTLKPLDKQSIYSAAEETKLIVTLEEHQIFGGLGSAVAEVLAEKGYCNARFKRLGLDGQFCHRVGGQEYLRKFYSLDVEGIIKTIEGQVN